jgi:hypothetical protein
MQTGGHSPQRQLLVLGADGFVTDAVRGWAAGRFEVDMVWPCGPIPFTASDPVIVLGSALAQIDLPDLLRLAQQAEPLVVRADAADLKPHWEAYLLAGDIDLLVTPAATPQVFFAALEVAVFGGRLEHREVKWLDRARLCPRFTPNQAHALWLKDVLGLTAAERARRLGTGVDVQYGHVAAAETRVIQFMDLMRSRGKSAS